LELDGQLPRGEGVGGRGAECGGSGMLLMCRIGGSGQGNAAQWAGDGRRRRLPPWLVGAQPPAR